MNIKILTVGSAKNKWKILKDSFNRRLRMAPNGDFRNDRLSFLLQSEVNVTSEVKAASKSGFDRPDTASNSREPLGIGTEHGSVPNVNTRGAKEDNLEIFFRSIANTMSSFSPLQVAQLKLEICNLVGNVEIERNKEVPVLLSYDPSTQLTYALNGSDGTLD